MRGVAGEMHRYHAENPIAKAYWAITDAEDESGVSNRIRYPGSPRRKR